MQPVPPAVAGATGELKEAFTELEVRFPEALADEAWVELTSLSEGGERRVLFLQTGRRAARMEPVRLGPAILCHGGERRATRCEEIDVEAEMSLEMADVEGVDLVGRFVQGDEPVAARVALAPARLSFPTRFTLPVTADGEELERAVETNGESSFRVPRLAPGEYLLEAELASGRVYRSEPVVVPEPGELRRGRDSEKPGTVPVYDLGEIVIDVGLRVEVAVTDLEGRPLPGAAVGYSQRMAATRFKTFQAETDAEGKARLSGVDPELAGQATCSKAGFRFVRRSFDLPPARVDCALEPLARLGGRVVDGDGEGVRATVTLRGLEPAADRVRESTEREGFFDLRDLPAGEHELVVAAPGFAAHRSVVALNPGDAVELDEIPLLPGRELWGEVVDAETGDAVAGAIVQIERPAGAGESVTDEAGEFRLVTGFDGYLALRAGSDRHATRRIEVEPDQLDGEEPFEIRLSAGGRILAEVFDETTGLPCDGCRVRFGSAGVRTTDEDGRAISGPLDPGPCMVQLEHVQSRGSLIVRQGGQDVRRVEVRAGQTASVRFGEPKVTVEVVFDRPLPPGWKITTRGASFGTYRLEADGAFHVRWRPGELTELALAEAGPAVSRGVWLGVIPPDHGEGRLELELWDTLVSGRLVSAEEPAGGRSVELRSLADSRPRAWGRSDASGSFELPFVAPGSYALFVGESLVRVVTVREGRPETLPEIEIPA